MEKKSKIVLGIIISIIIASSFWYKNKEKESNIGTDEEVTIAELIKKIVRISGIKTRIVFDTTKPDGSPRRNSDNTKAKDKIGFVAKTRLDKGLTKTIEWYRKSVLLK